MNYSVQKTALISDIKINLASPINFPSSESPYGAMGNSDRRALTSVDINGDGWLDLFLHPSYFAYAPGLNPIVMLNDGTGKFFDGTSGVFKTIPVFQQSNNVFFEDFNKDGKVDFFVVDQGLELRGKTGGSWDGAFNQLWLQGADGKFVDATATLQHNAANFNHVSSMADVNGDGNADIVLTSLGGGFEGQGTAFYLGNGAGGFNYTTAGLPETIKYQADVTRQWNSKTIDYQFSGTNGVGDINNDGRMDLVTGSYLGADSISDNRTVRSFDQLANGDFVQKWSGNQPAALVSAVGVMGVAGIKIGDLDGDGLSDLLVMWENGSKTAVQVLKNMGGSQFSDTTVASLGSYLIRSGTVEDGPGYNQSISTAVDLVDFNNDGKLDIYLKQFDLAPLQLASGSPTGTFLYLNDGAGHFSPIAPTSTGAPLSAAQLATMTGNSAYGLGAPMIFDANNDGMNDIVSIEWFHNQDQSVFPYRMTTLHVSAVLGAETGRVYRAGDLGDNLAGSANSDTFYSGKGSDKFSGGSGTDTAVYSGNFANYKLSASGAAFTVRDAGGIGSSDTLSGVERITFSNATVALFNGSVSGYQISKSVSGVVSVSSNGAATDVIASVDRIMFNDAMVRFDIDGVGGQAYRVYQAAFGRTPDSGGLGFWIGAMDGGLSLNAVADGFASSTEFQDLYGTAPSSREIIDRFYKNVLHREGEKAGVDHWTGVLDAKAATVAEVLIGFSESPENQAALVGVISNGISYTPFG